MPEPNFTPLTFCPTCGFATDGCICALVKGSPQPIVETFEAPDGGGIVQTFETSDGTIIVESGSEDILNEFKESMEREAQRRAHWGTDDYRKKMALLSQRFPTLRGVPGTDPWDAELLIKWMNGPAPTSGSWNAAMFMLGLWNPRTNWKEYGLKLRKGVQGKFDMFRALSCWDANHEAAFLEWIKYPFWP